MSALTDSFAKLARYRRQYGLFTALYYAKNQIFHGSADDYPRWLKRHPLTEEELAAQRGAHFDCEPTLSVVVPLYKTPIRYLNALVESFQAQTYPNWELCLSNGSGEGHRTESGLTGRLAELTAADSRIRVVTSETPLGISDNTNKALEIATGDYIGFADHDDMLMPNAFYEVVSYINSHPDADFIYSDEDKVDAEGKHFSKPHFKPDFNPEMMHSLNYISHLTFIRRDLCEEVGALDAQYDGAQDYDYYLRCIEKAHEIGHIRKILYHWRTHGESTAEKPENKMYCYDAGVRAMDAHYVREGIDAKAEVLEYGGTTYWGIFRTRYAVQGEPLVSVIVVTEKTGDQLSQLNSILDNASYRNLEVITCAQEQIAYGEACNTGRAQAHGEYLLFMGGDVTDMMPGTIEEMLSHAQQKGVAAVGPKILGSDGRVADAGLILGAGAQGIDAQFQRFRYEDPGYFGRAIMAQNLSAVSAQCMMVSAALFDEAGMFDPAFGPQLAGADLCCRLTERGWRHVYTPFATVTCAAYGRNSSRKSLIPEDSQKEIEKFQKKWLQDESYEDPCYNPNLTHKQADYKFDT